jgi:hypothetical protein
MHRLFSASIALAPLLFSAVPLPARADAQAEINMLRQEIDAMRTDYEARLRALEKRLQAAGASPVTAAPAMPMASSPKLPVAAGSGANAFNPAISMVLSGTYTRTSRDPAQYAISGFSLPTDAAPGPGSRGLSLAESELDLAASIDPWFRGAANISLRPDDSVGIEEAYVQTTGLGNGLTLKAGRFFADIGYLNSQHSHRWDFVDNPLAYQAMLGTQYGDDGLQLKWLLPIDHFVEFGTEVGRGRSFPGTDTSRNAAGMTSFTVRTGGDIGESQNWRVGMSLLNAKANDQSLPATNLTGDAITNRFSGTTRVWIADAIWKWAPNGNATRTSLKLQAEYLRSTRRGTLTYDIDSANNSASATGAYRAVQSGWYLQGVYQFLPRWRLGLRTEKLNAGSPDYGTLSGLFANNYRPHKNTLMIDFNLSEFSRMRLQLARDNAREGITDNQLLLQYQMSLGAHGAHNY